MDVKLPDGYVLKNVPDGTTKEQIAEKLKGAHGTSVSVPRGTESAQTNTKLSPLLSGVVRPIAKAATGLPLMAEELGVGLRNKSEALAQTAGIADPIYALNRKIEKAIPTGGVLPTGPGPKYEPTDVGTFNTLLDQYTTAPTTGVDKATEFIDTLLAGAITPGAGASSAVPGGASRAAPAVRTLADKGVVMTPGQRGAAGGSLGTTLSSWEQKLTSWPVIGDIIKNARGKSVDQFARATVDDALKHVKQKLPSDVKGAEAIQTSSRMLDEAYDTLLPKLNGTLTSLKPELDQITKAQELSPQAAATLDRIVQTQVIKKFAADGSAKGRTLQSIREELRRQAETYGRGGPEDRDIASALRRVRGALDRMIAKDNPGELGDQFKSLQLAYAKHEIAARASEFAKGRGGNYSANQFLNAAFQSARKRGKNQWRKGEGLQQDLAQAGSKVLSATEPNSGTVDRGLIAAILANPEMAIPGIAAGIPGSILYSQPVLRALQNASLTPGSTEALQQSLSKALTVGMAGEIR